MAIPVTPPIPTDKPVAIWLEPVMELQRKGQFWARLSGIAAMVVGVGAMGAAYFGVLPWLVGIIGILIPLLPIAAETRIAELGRKLEDQVRDQMMDAAKDAVEANPRDVA